MQLKIVALYVLSETLLLHKMGLRGQVGPNSLFLAVWLWQAKYNENGNYTKLKSIQIGQCVMEINGLIVDNAQHWKGPFMIGEPPLRLCMLTVFSEFSSV